MFAAKKNPTMFGAETDEKMFERKLDTNLATVIRLDGVNFSSFVRAVQCERPFDPGFTAWMTATLQALMTSFRFHAGFCGSDELSLVWFPAHQWHLCAKVSEPVGGGGGGVEGPTLTLPPPVPDPDAASKFVLPYGGRVLKLCSVLASKASAAFLQAAAAHFAHDRARLDAVLARQPAFDCRLWQVGSCRAALEALHLRQVYTLKNARMMLAQHHLPAKALHGVSSRAAADMVAAAKGIRFEDAVQDAVRIGTYALWDRFPVVCRDGVVLRKRLVAVQHFGVLGVDGDKDTNKPGSGLPGSPVHVPGPSPGDPAPSTVC